MQHDAVHNEGSKERIWGASEHKSGLSMVIIPCALKCVPNGHVTNGVVETCT